MRLSFIYQIFNQEFSLPDDKVIRNIVIDSRVAQEGDVFFAICGQNFDGHDFIDDVLDKGVVAVVVSDTKFKGLPFIVVNDTTCALGQLATAWREEINPYVFGITGSSGKTTVKDLAATILQSIYSEDQVLATTGNLNNQFGVPLTLLKLSRLHQFAVIEMGMNHSGELSLLTRIAKPNVALINNVLRAHIGCGFESLEEIAMAKSEILEGLVDEGIAVLPKNSSQFALLLSRADHYHVVRTFGSQDSDVYATNIKVDTVSSACHIHTPLGVVEVTIPLPGLHNVHNVLAVFALLIDIPKISIADIALGITRYQSQPGRLFISCIAHNSQLIDDSYNANPDSMKAALLVLANMPHQKIFIMGDMGELGNNALDMHAEIGSFAQKIGIDYLLAIGGMSKIAVDNFGINAEHYDNKHDLFLRTQELLVATSSILVKGSRFMQMEDICHKIKQI